MIAETAVIRLARRSRFSGAMMGMPPPTLASERRSTPRWRAGASRRGPCFPIPSLFAVTTYLPPSRARVMKSSAGCSPPSTSTTMSTAGAARRRGGGGGGRPPPLQLPLRGDDLGAELLPRLREQVRQALLADLVAVFLTDVAHRRAAHVEEKETAVRLDDVAEAGQAEGYLLPLGRQR